MKCRISKWVKIGIFIGFLVIFQEVFKFSTNAENQLVFKSNSNNQNKIAITFDDGPHPRKTKEILDILEKYNVKSTFFVIGVNVKNYPESVDLIASKGHEIGNHTFSHSILKSKSINDIKRELFETEKILEEHNIPKIELLRPPCGLYDGNLLKVAKDMEYKIVLWTIDTEDWAHKPSKEIVSNIIKNLHGGDIILFHDYTSGINNTAVALDTIIPELLGRGYELVTVSELLQN